VKPIPDLIHDTTVHSSLYADPAIFAQEMQQIFGQGWVYVGHQSEIPKRGDYIRRTMGLEPVILTRGTNGFHVLANRCAHRGNLLCQPEKGNKKAFACQYHGWVFGPTGDLLDVPLSSGGSADRSKLHLKRATVDSYKGFIFATFNPEPCSLLEHLGNATVALDRAVALSPAGEVEIRSPWIRHLFRANWKMLSENEADGYHVSFVHDSFTKAVKIQGKYSNVLSGEEEKITAVVRFLGNGHTELDYGSTYKRPLEWLGVQQDRFPEYTRAMHATYGEERADEISRSGPPHTFIFPNLFLAETCLVMIQPLSVGETVNWHTPLFLKDATPAVNMRILRKSEVAMGPSSFLTADDAIIAERQWRALCGSPAWLDLSRGIERETTDEAGNLISHYTDETPNRGFWRHYRSVMADVSISASPEIAKVIPVREAQ
jgi:phenylpropionate dioxygenase-like ring-hydroxylating dioxygenase large terminal subunit